MERGNFDAGDVANDLAKARKGACGGDANRIKKASFDLVAHRLRGGLPCQVVDEIAGVRLGHDFNLKSGRCFHMFVATFWKCKNWLWPIDVGKIASHNMYYDRAF